MAPPTTSDFDAFDRLAGSLEDFAAENGHFRAMCPVHEGHRPALTISVEGEPPNRKILLHCHAECGKQEILDALELTKADLFERPRTKGGGSFAPIVATYDNVDIAGNLVTQTTRHEPKDFRQRRPDGNGGWKWGIQDVDPVLYNLPAVTRTVMDGGTVFVCEGEKDCDGANQVLGAAGTFTTCPMGSGKWRDSYTQALRGASVVLIPDSDEPGQKHMQQVANALLPVAKSVKVLELPGVPEDGGDLSDWLDAGGTADEFETLMKNAPKFDSDHAATPPLMFDPNRILPFKGVKEILEAGGEDIPWIIEGVLARGSITEISGAAKLSGKTTFLLDMSSCLIEGLPFLGKETEKCSVAFLTEQGNNLKEALQIAGLGPETEGLHILQYLDVRGQDWHTLAQQTCDYCHENGIEVLVVDTMVEFGQIEDENLVGPVRDAMQSLKKAAQNCGLGVAYSRHHNKQNKGRGSSQFDADYDFSFTLTRPEGNHKDTVRVLHGEGRSRALPKNMHIDLQDGGYVVVDAESADSIQFKKSVRAIKAILPRKEEHAKERSAIEGLLTPEGHSKATLKRALRWMVDEEIVHKMGRGVKGDPERFWMPTREPGFDSDQTSRVGGNDDPNRILNANAGDENDDNKARESILKTPITTPEGLFEALFGTDGLASSAEVALDLETMPPDGWKDEVEAAFVEWRDSLKTKPKDERAQKKRKEISQKVYKRYAVDPATARARLVSIATENGLNEVVDATQVDISPLLEVLQKKTLITHNASFDLGVLRERYGYVHEGRVVDTQLLYLLHHYADAGERTEEQGNKLTLPDPTKKKGMSTLATLADKYLNVSLDKAQQGEDWSLPELPPEMIRYALEDSRILLDLSAVLTEKLEAIGMKDVIDLESRALPAIVNMERNGFPASVEAARAMAEKYAAEREAALEKLESLIPEPLAPDGREWRWSVPEHVRAALKALGADLSKLPKTNSGEPSTAKGALRKITGPPKAAEWVEAYLNHAALEKQEKDFVNAYADLIKDGVIRGSYTKTVATGRLSCRKPNLQQVPARGELQTKDGMRVRSIFRAPAEQAFVVADFEQVELLLAATLAGEEEMLKIFREGGDIHRETASWVLDKPPKKVTKPERTLAKALNFGLIYGCSAERLLESATNGYGVEDLTLGKAKKYRAAFFEKYPALKSWHAKVEGDCSRDLGYSSTPLGRRRKLPYWKDSATPAHTVAKNAPVQGAGADAIKLTLAKLFEDRHNCPGDPQLRCSVHDEVVLTVEDEHKDAALAWVAEHMAAAEREVVKDPDSPIAVDVEARKSW